MKPQTFDAHRFMNLRKGTVEDPLAYKNREQYQFVTVTKDFMAFGYGRHAWYVGNDLCTELTNSCSL